MCLLQAGKAVRGYRVVGSLNFHEDDPAHPVLLEQCWDENLKAVHLSFKSPVRLANCHFVRRDFSFAYFLQGLTIENCAFENYLNFQSGGHNQPGFLLHLLRNTFHGFVNFFDCWYRAAVQIEHNDFLGQTNLLSFSANYMAFDVVPHIQHNTGELHRTDEGIA
ncbi:hypothetical protein Hsw_3644 [Hymenobacter swuensis DY53]|uniref:Right handed beta helix domain-containing protein n=1 Tax=Hymenobacter swuensis DY53 TaxID=1227739 RepID=W8F1G4_9BACT|nr:hypothetical protein Hsw_3644 [Hymenobacter swuensis DY53]